MEVANLFMKIDGIKGSSTDNDFKDWIPVLSFSNKVHRSVELDNSQIKSGSIYFSEAQIVKEFDKSSSDIYGALLNGAVIKEIEVAQIVEHNKKKVEQHRYKFTNCVISDMDKGLISGEKPRCESIVFSFSTISMTTYTAEQDGSSTKSGPFVYDIVKNKS